jgi:hypothetical protein
MLTAPPLEDGALSLVTYSVTVFGAAACHAAARGGCGQGRGGCGGKEAVGPCNVSAVLLTEGASANVSAVVTSLLPPVVVRLQVRR